MNDETFNSIMKGAEEALAHLKGEPVEGVVVHTPADIVKHTRKAVLGMTQDEFAETFGISKMVISQWERGHRKPPAVARALFTIIRHNPEAALAAMRAE